MKINPNKKRVYVIMQLSNWVTKNIFINLVCFILTNLILLPFNAWLKSTLNNRFYCSYEILFLVSLYILFQIFLIINYKNLKLLKTVIFGAFSGYIISIIAYEGMCLIVLNEPFLPLNIEDAFHLLIVIPFLLFGWLYGLVMSIMLCFFLKRFKKKS